MSASGVPASMRRGLSISGGATAVLTGGVSSAVRQLKLVGQTGPFMVAGAFGLERRQVIVAAATGPVGLLAAPATLGVQRYLGAVITSPQVTGRDASLVPARRLVVASGAVLASSNASAMRSSLRIVGPATGVIVLGHPGQLVTTRHLIGAASVTFVAGSELSLEVRRAPPPGHVYRAPGPPAAYRALGANRTYRA